MLSTRDLLLGLLVIVIWAVNVVTIKIFVSELPPFTAQTIRFGLTVLIFLPFMRWPGWKKFSLIAQIAILLCVLHQGALFWSLTKLEASMTSILLQLQVIFSVILGAALFGEKFGWRTGVGVAFGIVGVIILVGLPEQPPAMVGVIGMIVCTSTLALAYARMKALTDIAPATYICLVHVVAVVPVGMASLALEAPLDIEWGALDTQKLAAVILYQVLIVSSAHMLWQRLMSRNSLGIMPTLTLLVPVLGVLASVIMLGEKITPSMVIGGAVTIFGVAIIMVRKSQKKEEATPIEP